MLNTKVNHVSNNSGARISETSMGFLRLEVKLEPRYSLDWNWDEIGERGET